MRARERASAHARMCVYVCVRACVSACVCVYVCVCARACTSIYHNMSYYAGQGVVTSSRRGRRDATLDI